MPKEPNPDAQLFRISEAAAILGIGRRTLSHLALTGEVPYYLLGSSHRWFSPDDLNAYRETNRRPGKAG